MCLNFLSAPCSAKRHFNSILFLDSSFYLFFFFCFFLLFFLYSKVLLLRHNLCSFCMLAHSVFTRHCTTCEKMHCKHMNYANDPKCFNNITKIMQDRLNQKHKEKVKEKIYNHRKQKQKKKIQTPIKQHFKYVFFSSFTRLIQVIFYVDVFLYLQSSFTNDQKQLHLYFTLFGYTLRETVKAFLPLFGIDSAVLALNGCWI